MCTAGYQSSLREKPPTRFALRRARSVSRRPDLLGAGLLLREGLERVEELAVGEHLVVQVIAGGSAGVADVADEVSALHFGALLHSVVEEVPVARLKPKPWSRTIRFPYPPWKPVWVTVPAAVAIPAGRVHPRYRAPHGSRPRP